MPRKVTEIIKLIEADGWFLVAVRGSHRQYKHPTKPGRTTIAGKPSATLHPRTGAEHPDAGRTGSEDLVIGYVVVVERDEAGGYSTWSPDLPGCVAADDDFDECLRLMSGAMRLHIDGMRADGLQVPKPSALAALILPAA